MEAESGAVYCHKVWWGSGDKISDYVYSDFAKTLADARESWSREEVEEIRYYKIYTDIERKIELIADYDGNPLLIITIGAGWDALLPDSDIQDMFGCDGFFVDIPMPFKRGDILAYHSRFNKEDIVFVLDSLCQDDEEHYQRYLDGELGDGGDINGHGLFATDEGLLCYYHAYCQDRFAYYRGKLEGAQRILHYASLFLKGEEGFGVVELMTMQGRLMAERQLEDVFDIKSHNCHVRDELLAENRVVGEDEGDAKG
jgi:hypothetical protein